MTNSPLVSVVIPVYDDRETIKRAVRSVIDQSYERLEVIVVDDCSPEPINGLQKDFVSDKLERFDIYRHKYNQGAAAARNTGIRNAKGEFIAFLDADDRWLPEKITLQVEKYNSSSDDVGVVYTGIRQVDEYGRTNGVKKPKLEGWITKQLLLWNKIGTFSSILISSEVIDQVGYLDERFPSWQDWEFFLRISMKFAFAAIPKPLVVRHNEGNQISDNYPQKRNVSAHLIEEKFRPFAADYGHVIERKMMANIQYHLANSAFMNDQYASGRRHLLGALQWYPFHVKAWTELFVALGGRRAFEGLRKFKRELVRRHE